MARRITELEMHCPDLPKVGIFNKFAKCRAENCPHWLGYQPDKDPPMPLHGIIRIGILVQTPTCAKYGSVAGYGLAGRYRQNKHFFTKELW